jgi:hypothetical protein
VQPTTFASRAGRWSAHHRKTAIFGWLAFVVIAFVLGGAIGTNAIKDEDSGNGASRTADQQIAAADYPKKSNEQVLVQAKGAGKASAAVFTLAVMNTTKRLEHTKYVTRSSRRGQGQRRPFLQGRRSARSRSDPRRRRPAKAASTRPRHGGRRPEAHPTYGSSSSAMPVQGAPTPARQGLKAFTRSRSR